MKRSFILSRGYLKCTKRANEHRAILTAILFALFLLSTSVMHHFMLFFGIHRSDNNKLWFFFYLFMILETMRMWKKKNMARESLNEPPFMDHLLLEYVSNYERRAIIICRTKGGKTNKSPKTHLQWHTNTERMNKKLLYSFLFSFVSVFFFSVTVSKGVFFRCYLFTIPFSIHDHDVRAHECTKQKWIKVKVHSSISA